MAIGSSYVKFRKIVPPKPLAEVAAYLCTFCNHLLVDAQQCGCGDRACGTCVDAWKNNLRKSGRTSSQCPRCQEALSIDDFFSDRAAQRELQQIPVACPNEGCQWNGYYSNYEGHYIKCDYQPTQCVHSGCGEMVAKGMLKRHAEQCQFRPQQCEWGQENILLRNMKGRVEGSNLAKCENKPPIEQSQPKVTERDLVVKCPECMEWQGRYSEFCEYHYDNCHPTGLGHDKGNSGDASSIELPNTSLKPEHEETPSGHLKPLPKRRLNPPSPLPTKPAEQPSGENEGPSKLVCGNPRFYRTLSDLKYKGLQQ